MPFTNPKFPGRLFKTLEELKEAERKRAEVEEIIKLRAGKAPEIEVNILPEEEESLLKDLPP